MEKWRPVELLEPRILFSADGLDVTPAVQEMSQSLSVVLIDSSLADVEHLTDAVDESAWRVTYDADTSAEAIVARIADIASASGREVDSLSLLSHGSAGRFSFGSDTVDMETLSGAGAQVWLGLSEHLAEGADLALYACNVAAEAQLGAELINQIAVLSGADVFASDDLTGLGGDWTLELASEGDAAELAAGLDSGLDLDWLSRYEHNLAGTISGTIYEDVDGDGAVADDGVGVSGVEVTLYTDDGDGVIDAGDAWTASTMTDGSGGYSFAGVADATYWVVVDSKTLSPDGGFNAGSDIGDVWAEQTYATAGAVTFDGSYDYQVGAGSLYGGMRLEAGDDASSLTTAEHVTRVTIAGSDVTGVDSGFSFQAITRTGDGDDDGAADRTMQGSLRQFILNSNAIVGAQTSQFAMSTADSNYNRSGTEGEWTVLPTSALPDIADTVILDATTQAGYVDSPLIEIDGTGAGAVDGLVVLSGGAGSEIRGLAINNFASAGGISVWAPVTIAGNFLGTDITGTVAAGNYHGVDLMGSSDATVIGGTDVADRNVISGNLDSGIVLFSGADNVTILNNYLGVDATGTAGLGNATDGIEASGVSGLTIGQAGAGNVISANLDEGLHLKGIIGATIQGNLIGTNAAGTAGLGNADEGIDFDGPQSSDIVIGGLGVGEGNVISANGNQGLELHGITNLTLSGNYIGTDAAGAVALANTQDGLYLGAGIDGAVISGNVISGNVSEGIYVDGALGVVITGNKIGTDAGGTVDLGNGDEGIYVTNATVTIGGATWAEGNLISGNASQGVELTSGSDGSLVRHNYLGTDVTGTLDLGNDSHGLQVSAANVSVQDNVAGGNGGHGIYFAWNATGFIAQGNQVGTTADGTAALYNDDNAIHIVQADDGLIGGYNDSDRNVLVWGEDGRGIYSWSSADNNQVLNNYFGLDVTGMHSLGVADSGVGVYVQGGSGWTIGAVGAGNVIGDSSTAIILHGSGVHDVTVQANLIGTNVDRSEVFGAKQWGVWLWDAHDNLIGGTNAGQGNVIAGAGWDGIRLFDDGTVNNRFLGNIIYDFGMFAINPESDDRLANDSGDTDGWQNYPVLTSATIDENGLATLVGELNSTADTTFRVELFSGSNVSAEGVADASAFVGYLTVTTDAEGHAEFSHEITGLSEGLQISATVTGSGTSEFSLPAQLELVLPPEPEPEPEPDPEPPLVPEQQSPEVQQDVVETSPETAQWDIAEPAPPAESEPELVEQSQSDVLEPEEVKGQTLDDGLVEDSAESTSPTEAAVEEAAPASEPVAEGTVDVLAEPDAMEADQREDRRRENPTAYAYAEVDAEQVAAGEAAAVEAIHAATFAGGQQMVLSVAAMENLQVGQIIAPRAYSSLNESGGMWSQMASRDEARRRVQATEHRMREVSVGAVVGVSAVASVGYLVWTIKSGALLSSFVAALPSWRVFDPLPVLDFWDKKKGKKNKPKRKKVASAQSIMCN